MTTAQQPWSVEYVQGSKTAKLKDAQGNMVALFPDYNNADLVMQAVNSQLTLDKKLDKVLVLLEDRSISEAIEKIEALQIS
jgi:hypothetical protein